MPRIKSILFASCLFLLNTNPCRAYSVLTHEALIDVNWELALLPLLQQKFPGSSPSQFNEARAYAYGGSIAPDLGYYPFGSRLFTDLVHYVRTGDFVNNLLSDAQDINEYAFALGVLCHYYADKYGHGVGINECVPIIYPKMKRKFGSTVTYADNHISHIRTEFSFDVLQTARGNYSSTAYHKFIGFQLAQPLLERTFLKTYGININSLFKNLSRTISRFRWIVINLFPEITRAAWQSKRQLIRQATPDARARNFIFRMRRKNYLNDFSKGDKKPGFFAHVLAAVIRMVPKVGPLRALHFSSPGPEAEGLFIKSFDSTILYYSDAIDQLSEGNLKLINIDFDTGKNAGPGEYIAADDCYVRLLTALQDRQFEGITSSLKDNILVFYANYMPPDQQSDNWKRTGAALEQLKKTLPRQ